MRLLILYVVVLRFLRKPRGKLKIEIEL